MKQLTVGFSTHKGLSIGSKLIRLWMNTTFSHTYLYFKLQELDQYTVFHAVGTGPQFISKDTFLLHNIIIREFSFNVSEEQYHTILNKCHQASGRLKYGYLQNLGLVLARLFKRKNNLFDAGVNCSEWIADCIIEIDPEAFSKFNDLNLVTPKDVYNYLDGKYGKISKY